LPLGSIELAIANERDGGRWRHNRLDLRDQPLMDGLREVTLRCSDNHPTERERATVIGHAHHQRQTATTDHTAIHHDLDRLGRQRGQKHLCHRQIPAIERLLLMLHPAPKATNQALLGHPIGGRRIGDGRQMGAPSARQATDQDQQRGEMLGTVPGWMGAIALQQRPLYGMMPTIRATHGCSS
jgi:hypothetical protein